MVTVTSSLFRRVRERQRGPERWLLPYLMQWRKRRPTASGESVHLLLCIADHFEPRHGGVSPAVAEQRVRQWVEGYPRLVERFRDSDGRPPRHTFFYPIEQYDPGHVDALAGLCRAGYGEVEVHLHHENDTAESLRERLTVGKQLLAERHGLLARDKGSGAVAYGFVHGDWSLDNSHPNSHHCGVDNELSVLVQTGCYADFTLPSAPDPTQTRKINSLYYARGRPGCRMSHDSGIDVADGAPPADSLLLVQGPLLLNWRRRKYGVLPRIENGCLQASQPPEAWRLDLWLRARVQVRTRPDWFFVKLHTHGAIEPNQRVLLGEPMAHLHAELARRAREDANFHFHYVTARETYNLVKAAEAGWRGDVNSARDFALVGPISEESPCRSTRHR